MQGQDRVRRLRWLCRRGMKELDLLLEAFVQKHGEALANGEMPRFEEFLDQEDDLVWDWLQGSKQPADPEMAELVAAIRGDA